MNLQIVLILITSDNINYRNVAGRKIKVEVSLGVPDELRALFLGGTIDGPVRGKLWVEILTGLEAYEDHSLV